MGSFLFPSSLQVSCNSYTVHNNVYIFFQDTLFIRSESALLLLAGGFWYTLEIEIKHTELYAVQKGLGQHAIFDP